MKRFLGALALVALICSDVAPAPAKAAGLAELERFLGTWESPGTLLDTPYSKAGSASATTTCAWSIDRAFMICQQRVSINGKPDHGVSVYSYNASKNQYRFYRIGTGGANDAAIAIAGNTVTYTTSFADNGKQVTIRTRNVWENPTFYRWRTEYSTDAGVTWSLMGSGTSQRR